MKTIKLTQGKEAIVLDEDYDKVAKYKWHFNSSGYAARMVRHNQFQLIVMHRYLWELNNGPIPKEKQIDHISHDKLDNRLENLRLVSNSQNQMNCSKRKNTSSRFKGVFWSKEKKKWRAYICKDGHITCIGSYDSEIDAAKSYNCYAIVLFGRYACLNDWRSKK